MLWVEHPAGSFQEALETNNVIPWDPIQRGRHFIHS